MEKLQIEQILTLHKENKITLEKATESILLLLSVVERNEQFVCSKCGKNTEEWLDKVCEDCTLLTFTEQTNCH
jgi:hypothetical protein